MTDRHIVVVGGGIIGCCSAYYLSRHPKFDRQRHKITLVESSTIAGGSSGKAGGLVAEWAFPKELSKTSFDLHKALAEEYNGGQRWGYRSATCAEVEANGRSKDSISKAHGVKMPLDLDWLDQDGVKSYDEVGDESITAQVHPYQFTTAIADLAKEAGVEILLNKEVTAITTDESNSRATGIQYRDRSQSDNSVISTLQATDIIIAAGPWTPRLYSPAPISTYRVHSITIRPTRVLSPYTIFTTIKLPSDFHSATNEAHQCGTSPGVAAGRRSRSTVTPEIYARPNHEVYVGGESDETAPLPDLTSDVEVEEDRCRDIYDYVSSISTELREGEMLVQQACYLPLVDSSSGEGPIVGATGIEGLVLAAGHSCWGISNGPASGKAVSEVVFDGVARCVDLTRLDPRPLCREGG